MSGGVKGGADDPLFLIDWANRMTGRGLISPSVIGCR